MEKAGKILILASAAFLCTCVTDFQSVAPPTSLSITVQNGSSVLLDGADLYVFDNANSFNQAIGSGSPAGFVSTAKSTNGIALFDQLAPEVLYYIYAVYKDTAPIAGTYITYDNADEKYSLKNSLSAGSLTSLRIVLKPADGLITFWTTPSNNPVLPISIFSGSASIGTIAQSFATAPAAFSTGAVTLRARKGTVVMEGKSAAGCLWTDTFTVTGGQNVFYKLGDCGVGTIAFYTDNTNATKLPINIKLNANDALSDLTTISSSVPTTCSAPNLVTAVRIPGTYTYEAISPSGNCLWTGTFTLGANACNLIALPTCP